MAGQLDFTISSGFLGFAMPHLGRLVEWRWRGFVSLNEVNFRWFCWCPFWVWWSVTLSKVKRWPPTKLVDQEVRAWITWKSSHSSTDLFGSLGKTDTARLPEFFAGSHLDLKWKALRVALWQLDIGISRASQKEFKWVLMNYQGSLPIFAINSRLFNFQWGSIIPNCRVYSAVRCAVWMCWMYLYCRFLQAGCQVAEILVDVCVKIPEG